jgi:paraquat-inducible protein A
MKFHRREVQARLQARFKSTSTAAALALSAAVMLIPANLLPVLSTETSGRNRTDTIFSGTVSLWRHNLEAIAVIVFTASILIPVLKLAGLGWLLWCTHRGTGNARRLTRLYATLDFIGRWSMLDVFLVAFLAGLVQFGDLSTVEPRNGIVAFAAAVVLTIFATRAFDPRLLWSTARFTHHP